MNGDLVTVPITNSAKGLFRRVPRGEFDSPLFSGPVLDGLRDDHARLRLAVPAGVCGLSERHDESQIFADAEHQFDYWLAPYKLAYGDDWERVKFVEKWPLVSNEMNDYIFRKAMTWWVR